MGGDADVAHATANAAVQSAVDSLRHNTRLKELALWHIQRRSAVLGGRRGMRCALRFVLARLRVVRASLPTDMRCCPNTRRNPTGAALFDRVHPSLRDLCFLCCLFGSAYGINALGGTPRDMIALLGHTGFRHRPGRAPPHPISNVRSGPSFLDGGTLDSVSRDGDRAAGWLSSLWAVLPSGARPLSSALASVHSAAPSAMQRE